jgi:hypothetical protein
MSGISTINDRVGVDVMTNGEMRCILMHRFRWQTALPSLNCNAASRAYNALLAISS